MTAVPTNHFKSLKTGNPFKPRNYPSPMSSVETAQQKRKVLFVIDTLQFGGAEQSLVENTARFSMIEPVVCHLYEGDILKPRIEKNNIKVYSLNIKKKYGFIEAYKKLKEVVQNEKPELLVGYLTRSETVTRLIGKFYGIPVVGTFVNDLYCKSYNQNLSWKAKQAVRVFKLVNQLTSRICVGFVSNSQAIKTANGKHLKIPLEKIAVINRGRDSLKFRRKNNELSRASGSIRFLNVSRLFPVKGQKNLILGFKKFLDKSPGETLYIVGDGPLRDELTTLIKDNNLENNVFLLGSRNDVPAIISDYDCFVFPSLVEGFSGAIVEAMFAGLPVLASDIPQNTEAITHMQTGYLFKRESADDVEKAMIWFKENRPTAEALAANAYEYAKENFELNTIVSRFENYLLKMIEEN